MFIPSTFKRPVSSWKALNLRKTLLMASSVRLKPLNCSRLPCVYAQETLTFLLTQKKTCVQNYVQKQRSEERRVGKECRCRWRPDHRNKKEAGARPGSQAGRPRGLEGRHRLLHPSRGRPAR